MSFVWSFLIVGGFFGIINFFTKKQPTITNIDLNAPYNARLPQKDWEALQEKSRKIGDSLRQDHEAAKAAVGSK
jgi:hypothetical protein